MRKLISVQSFLPEGHSSYQLFVVSYTASWLVLETCANYHSKRLAASIVFGYYNNWNASIAHTAVNELFCCTLADFFSNNLLYDNKTLAI